KTKKKDVKKSPEKGKEATPIGETSKSKKPPDERIHSKWLGPFSIAHTSSSGRPELIPPEVDKIQFKFLLPHEGLRTGIT
ncbi:hypothetical protein LINPERPRIM_LOCUS743, partial [Linum perenne]